MSRGGNSAAFWRAFELTRFLADDKFPPLRPPTRQVSIDESRHSTPPIPPGFEGHLGLESRRSTPSIPPGLAKPTALPDLEGSLSRPTSRPSSRASLRRQASQILPALPLRPATPHRVATPSKLEIHEDANESQVDETPTKKPRKTTSNELSFAEVAEVVESKSKTPAAGSNSPTHADVVSSSNEEQAATPVSKSDTAQLADIKVSPSVVMAVSGDTADPQKSTADTAKPNKTETNKRKHPGKLDISAAVNANDALATRTPATSETPSSRKVQPIPSSAVSSTPSTTKAVESPMPSPAVRPAPRTLRVVQTPKAETAPVSVPSVPSMAAAVAAHKLPSRQPSVASIVLPGTPSSEQVSISDNISLASTSQSRANSPAPGGSKVGSAPVRAKTKSQQKKERQERAKALEEGKAKEGEGSVQTPAEPVVEAIQSRKKKTKKEKEVRLKPKAAANVATADTTPTASRTPSPRRRAATDASAVAEELPIPAHKDQKPPSPLNSQPPPAHPSSGPSPPVTPTLTPAQLIAELKASAPQIQKCIDSLFRVSNTRDFKAHHNISHKELLSHWQSELKFNLNKNDFEALLTGKVPAVPYGDDEGRIFNRGLITPSGANLRALTKELESRFLELELALREMPEESRFRPSKPQNDVRLPFTDLEAVKRQYENGTGRGPSVMEQMVQDGVTLKKGAFLVDEASKYINEFVMPPVTPPPSATGASPAARRRASAVQGAAQGTATAGAAAGAGAGAGGTESTVPSVEVAERQLREAQKFADEREIALRKVMKKNKKLLGLG